MDDEDKAKQEANFVWSAIMALALGMMLMSILGCVETKYVPVSTKTSVVEKETLVPMPMPQDSATIRAWLECDEWGRVVMRWLETERSKRAQLQVSLDSMGVMMARMKTLRDTVYLPSREIVRTDSIVVPVPIEKPLGEWESRWMLIGKISSSILAAFLLYFVLKIAKFYKMKV